jgi:hypothetical protein
MPLELLLPLKLLELLQPLLLPLEQDHELPSGLEPLEPLELLGLLVFLDRAADVGPAVVGDTLSDTVFGLTMT